ncbi:4'-phosphopantetheinyl transferase family protein [Pseudoalteromonas viridis]|uniref:4'-phosphopantetheinyl transferase superfamily protein n=1 Tax=Pseudoalteromonas viridis TaxID=339617 RepID=A0ABX7V6V3_9GAMM|nr:4'-phosphopantetheinyl transferase superfamily protein [Pseudoalteromonas viridis]QTL35427.1 4'-phosphopantetheinyl transferase superfamily protein [Pseudoalteromonas viridis]
MIAPQLVAPVGEAPVSPRLYIRQYADPSAHAPRLSQGSRVKQQCRILATEALQQTNCTGHVRLCHTPSGQPFGFAGENQPLLSVSASHSQNWYAVATAPVSLGIDIQVYRGFSRSSQQRLFHHGERSADMLTQSARWSVREAYLKLHGRGLPFDFRDIQIQPDLKCGAVSGGRVTSQSGALTMACYWLWQTLYFCCAVCIAGNAKVTPTLFLTDMEAQHDPLYI